MKPFLFMASTSILALALVGCGGPSPVADTGPDTPPKKFSYSPSAPAGLGDVHTAPDTGQLRRLYLAASSKYGAPRHDPFALTHSEAEYDAAQNGARIFNQNGGYSLEYVPQPETEVIPTIEPQPYRRLAGVVVGDSVLAIIEMGDGQQAQIIRPGQKIPNSEWTVVSIDQEKAVLRREGDKLPKEITVRLETAKPGTAGYGGSAPGNGAPGYGGPGGPGGPPPGYGGPGMGNRGRGAPGGKGNFDG